MHFIIARYHESLDWLYEILDENETWTATVYDDAFPQSGNKNRINFLCGDHKPYEPTKYISYILSNWNKYSNNTQLVFTQADPIYHNHTFLDVLRSWKEWSPDYQNLSLCPHPDCPIMPYITAKTIPNLTIFKNGSMTWCDTDMDNNFQGSFWKDPFIDNLYARLGNITVQEMCDRFSLAKHTKHANKSYCAMFATNWKTIRKISYQQWKTIHDFITSKEHACIMEYMWAVILQSPPPKILHLTYHYGCANDANYIFKQLGYDITFFHATIWPYTITYELAIQIWNENKHIFQEYDIILTSDTTALSYPFLLHIAELKPKLIIWVCNRYNIGMENNKEFTALFKQALVLPNVKIVPYTKFEIEWCLRDGIHLREPIINALGRHIEPYISDPIIMNRIFTDCIYTNLTRPYNQSFFVPDYHNNHKLYNFLCSRGISTVTGRYTDINEIKCYKAVITLPDAVSKFFYFEAIQHDINLLLPSLTFLKELIQDPYYTFTSKQYIDVRSLGCYCDYYRNPEYYIYFESFDNLIEKLNSIKLNTNIIRKKHHDETLLKWSRILWCKSNKLCCICYAYF